MGADSRSKNTIPHQRLLIRATRPDAERRLIDTSAQQRDLVHVSALKASAPPGLPCVGAARRRTAPRSSTRSCGRIDTPNTAVRRGLAVTP